METENNDENNIVVLDEARRRVQETILSGMHDVRRELSTLNDPYLDQMNKKHAFINSFGGKPAILCHVYNEAFEKEIIEFRSPDAIAVQYSNQSVQVGNQAVPLGRWWIAHAGRREYDTVVFAPDKTKEFGTCLNLYEGLSLEPKKGDWSRTFKHLYRILSNADREKFLYTIKWLAWCLQNPGKRAEVVLIFKGKQGAGKGFIFTQFNKIFGAHALHISNRKHLTGDFNGHMATCVFLFADEAYYPGDKEVEGALNQLISEERIGIERKGKDLVIGKNCLHIGMATNAEWVIPANGDARRYYINEVDNKYAKNETDEELRSKYFDKLWGEMNNGGREAMVFDLLNFDLKGWHPRFGVPETEEYLKQTAMGSGREAKMIYKFLDQGELPFGEKLDGITWVCTARALKNYFMSINRQFDKAEDNRLKKIMASIGAIKVRKSDGIYWHFKDLAYSREQFHEMNKGFIFDDMAEEWVITTEQF